MQQPSGARSNPRPFHLGVAFREAILTGSVCGCSRHHACCREKKKVRGDIPLTCEFMVGTTGFEPAASRSRTARATKLRHVPIAEYILADFGLLVYKNLSQQANYVNYYLSSLLRRRTSSPTDRQPDARATIAAGTAISVASPVAGTAKPLPPMPPFRRAIAGHL